MGHKTTTTTTNHKPFLICNQTTLNTGDYNSVSLTTVLLYTTDYKWTKNSVEDLALVQNQFARNPLKE